jgi:HEAT repeat protein
MADATSKKLLSLLDGSRPPEVRRAAMVVLGEIGLREASIAGAVSEGLEDTDPAVRLAALSAAGKLGVERAIPQLLERVRLGGEESEAAARAASRLGAKGSKALQGLMPQVAPGLRRRIAAALAAAGTPSAEAAAVEALSDTDPGVVDASARELLARIPNLEARRRRDLAAQILKLLRPAKGRRLPAHSEAVLLRLAAALGEPAAEGAFWARLEPNQPAELRAAALQALGTRPPPTQREKLRPLLTCAADADFRVVAPALMILKTASVDNRALGDWLPLFDAPDPAARRFAVEKLGRLDTPPVAAALLRQLDHPDRSVRDQALAALGGLTRGRAALAQALLEADSPDQGWILARAQAAFARDYPAPTRRKIFEKACAYLENDDRRADPLLFLLREAEGKDLQARLEERAAALRKKARHADALVYLRALTRDPACGDPVRFELAACGLKLSPKSLEADARAADPSLEQFAGLIRRQQINVAEAVEKARWLDAEDLFYLGFHFVEGAREEREFGAGVLRLLLKRAPKTKRAKDAKNKLRSQGLA